MKPKITSFPKDTNWVKGKYDDYGFYAKLYDDGSVFGLNEGRVSKLSIFGEDEGMIINYDRGWDINPSDDYERKALHDVVNFLEKSPKRWT